MDTKRAANFYGSFNYIFFIYANITLSDQSDSCSGCRSIVLSLLKIYLDDEEDIKYKSPRSWKCNDKVIVAYSQKQGVL